MVAFDKLVRRLLLAHLLLLVLPNKEQARDANMGAISIVQCSSSYIDDYVLPTAKIAFNKIQQQFTPAARSAAAQTTSETSSATTTTGPAKRDELRADEEPNREPKNNEFVKLGLGRADPQTEPDIQLGSTQAIDVSGRPDSVKERGSQDDDDERDGASATLISDTESTSVDPTEKLIDSSTSTSTSTSISTSTSSSSSPPSTSPSTPTSTPTSISTSTSNPTSTSSSADQFETTATRDEAAPRRSDSGSPGPTPEGAAISNQIDGKTSEEAIRETELEAIGAVEASIGFGDSALFGGLAPTDACYDEYGNARHCEPEFENIAYERQVDTSSECGSPASRFCTAYVNERGDQIRNCHICDQQHPKKRHPAAFLTDMNNSNQPTCWVSAPIGATQAPANASLWPKRDNVTLTLNFDKRYELTYVSLQFCSLKPDSLAILKSADFGKSWTAYQFYSSQCARVYGRPTGSSSQLTGGQDGESAIEASCLNSSSPASGQANNRVAFSTLDGAARALNSSNSAPIEKSQPLQDWITATNIRVVLDQHQASWIQSSLAHHAHHQPARGTHSNGSSAQQQDQMASRQTGAGAELESSLTKPSDTYNYAISDLTVGGRCKCNGHASRCVHNADGRLQCDCQHNTDGPDCERCLPLHHDRPWQRATQSNANPCQPCNCNGHSRKCRFDSELYQLSGRRSGGVCIDCKDNTTGRHCHYCKEGFTRDQSRPMSDKEACKPCDCHPVGSVGKVCNQTTGQCPCKEGVTGLECNRCAPGYQQSSSPSEPCIKLPENDINYEPSIETVSEEQAIVQQLSAAGAELSNEPAIAPAQESPAIGAQSAQKPFRSAPNEQAPDAEPKQATSSMDSDEPAPMAHQATLSTRLPYPKQRNSWPRQKGWHFYPKHRPNYDDAPQEGYPVEELPDGFIYYPPEYGYAPARNRPFRVRYPKAGRQSGQVFGVAPIAKLDHDQQDDFVGGPRDESLIYEHPEGLNSLYPDDSAGFNQIQNTNNAPQMRKLRPQGYGFYPQPSPARAPIAITDDRLGPAQSPARQMGVGANNLACAECQQATKRLSFKQFCQLDYAIKAKILSRQKADDWTKFEVEIQDIFKSASSSALLLYRAQRHFLAEAPLGQHSENKTSPMESQKVATSNGQVVTGGSNSLPVLQDSKLPLHRALKVGSRQTIWIPTEDVECKCPRLKLHSIYLLMGLVDTKENSATSIQLDRHGVALEWKARSQEKLVKYQRRHSRGSC